MKRDLDSGISAGTESLTTPTLLSRIRSPKMILSAAIAVVACVSFLVYSEKIPVLGSRSMPPLTEKDTVLIADFDNRTGDTVFDDALKQALRIDVEQSPYLNVVPERRVAQALKLMNVQPGVPLRGEIARDVCQRVGSKAVFMGSIASLGSQYVVGMDAVDCRTGDSLSAEQIRISGKEEVLKGLDKAVARLRSHLGESLRSQQKFDVPLEEATTSSLEALKAYSIGLATRREKGDVEAIPFYIRAIELDPEFALAYASLGVAYSNLGQHTLSAKNITKAFELRNRVSERERYRFTAYYYDMVTGEAEKAGDVYDRWAKAYPGDGVPVGNSATNLMLIGQWQGALPRSLNQLPMDPTDVIGYVILGMNYIGLERLDEAQAVFDRSLAQGLEYVYTDLYLYFLAFRRDDSQAMQRLLEHARSVSAAENWLAAAQSNTEAYHGRLSRARALSRRAIESANHEGSREIAAMWQANAALIEAELGDERLARQNANTALQMASGRDAKLLAAVALARAGDVARAARLADELQREYPLNSMVQNYWLPLVRASLALRAHRPSDAIDTLHASGPYELAMFQNLGLGMMYPVYVRGEAYLAQHDGANAEAEFRKIVDHPGIVLNFPLGALARLGLARSYALQGNAAQAAKSYEEFLTLWRDADSDLPLLRRAKSEHATLR